MEPKAQVQILAQKRHHLTGYLDQKFQKKFGLQRSCEKPPTTQARAATNVRRIVAGRPNPALGFHAIYG